MKPELTRREVLALGGAAAAGSVLARPALAQPAAESKVNTPPATTAAPAQAPGFYRFKVGSLEAIALSDGFGSISPVHPMFAPEATPQQVSDALAAVMQPTDRLAIQFNILALKAAEGWVLFDTGSAQNPPKGTTGKLLANLAAAGLKPADIAAVVFSHLHGDHLQGAVINAQPTYPNARYFLSKAEHDFWMSAKPEQLNPAMPADARQGAIAGTQKALAALKGKLELVNGGDKVFKSIEFVNTFGHTPGHLSSIITDGRDTLCNMADLAHNHVLMFHNPGWTVAFDVDPKAAAATRRSMFDRLSADKARVMAYHLPWPGLGRIGKHGDGYWWAAEEWQWGA
jgi:glyoxylase-like metal-dependent hydrolase (beta-lactamase superfamily II)